MIIDQKQMDELHVLTKPLSDWLIKNCHPHCEISIDSDRAELKEGIAGINTQEIPDRLKPNAWGINAFEPTIMVGQYAISIRAEKGMLWIEESGGEGGTFTVSQFEEAVKVFYDKHF